MISQYYKDTLQKDEKFFQDHGPVIFLATHGKMQVDHCRGILTSYGYSMEQISRDLYGLECDEWLVKPHEKLP